jgi:hypothetical protein
VTTDGATYKENAAWGFDTDGLEELRMPERQLHQLTDLGHLLPTPTDVIVTDIIQVSFFVLTLDRLALTVDDGILSDYAIRRRINLDNLEFNLSHATANGEEIVLPERPISLTEVGCKEDVEERACKALHSVRDGEHGNTFRL